MNGNRHKYIRNAVAIAAAFLVMPLYAQEPESQLCAGTDAVEGNIVSIVEAGNRVVVGTASTNVAPDGGLFISCSDGDEWWKHPAFTQPVEAIAVDPVDSTNIYAQGDDATVARSRDGGATWFTARPVDGTNVGITALAALPGGEVLAGSGNGGLYRSTDYGETWQELATVLVNEVIHSILVDPDNTSRIFVIAGDTGVFQSLDGGQTFEQSRISSYLLLPTYWPLREIAFVPGNTSQLFAAGPDGLYRSVDGGAEFSGVALAEEFEDMAYGGRDTNSLFFAEKYDGFMRSDDGGTTFTSSAPEMPGGTEWFSQAAQLASGRILLGTVFEGMFKSDDDGASWQFAGAEPVTPEPPEPPSQPEVTAELVLQIQDLNGGEAVEVGERAKFRVTVRNDGPEVSTNTFVNFIWVQPNTNDASSPAYSVTSSGASCVGGIGPDAGCTVGSMAVGATVTFDFEGTISADFIGLHKITVTARNAENAEVVANGSVNSKRTIACFGDCDDSSGGGGGSAGLVWLGVLALVAALRGRRLRAF